VDVRPLEALDDRERPIDLVHQQAEFQPVQERCIGVAPVFEGIAIAPLAAALAAQMRRHISASNPPAQLWLDNGCNIGHAAIVSWVTAPGDNSPPLTTFSLEFRRILFVHCTNFGSSPVAERRGRCHRR
jgi:hypothetical protein